MTRIAITPAQAKKLEFLAEFVAEEMFDHDSQFDELDAAVEVLRDLIKRSQEKAKR